MPALRNSASARGMWVGDVTSTNRSTFIDSNICLEQDHFLVRRMRLVLDDHVVAGNAERLDRPEVGARFGAGHVEMPGFPPDTTIVGLSSRP